LKFLNENEGFQPFKNIEESCSEARLTIKKYLDELKDEELVEQSLDGRHPYRITEKGRKHFERLVSKRDIYDLTDSFDTKWLEILRRLLRNMREHGTNPADFFRNNCIAFVGGLPHYFHKSKEGMERALHREKELSERAAKEGLTKEEYFKKRAKLVAKLPEGMPRWLAHEGKTEEQIETIMRIREAWRKQGIPRIWASINEEEKKDVNTRAKEEGHARIKEEERKQAISRLPHYA
jgi:predicted transcriptional regulator